MKFSNVWRKGVPYVLPTLVCAVLLFPQIGLGSSGESGGGGVTVAPDGSVFIQIINFLFTIWVLNLLLYKPIRKILIQRKEKIQGLELSIETSDRDAGEKDQAFAAGIKEARAKGLQEKEALMQQAADEEKRIVAEINRQAQTELAALREKIKKDAGAVRDSLEKQIGDFASQISQKILGRAV